MKMLVLKALEAQKKSYSPYSNFQVGAAVLGTNGEIYTGCNVENAAYSPSNCGERTAIFKAVSEGVTEFSAIAIVGNAKGEEENRDFCPPCGVCLQVMSEFCDPESFKVCLVKSEDNYREYLLKEMLPFAFTPESLQ